MKKFFKSLALVLALTLVFGSVNTFAATAPKLATKTSKVLYLDGAKGSVTAEDGTVTASPKRASFVVKVSNAKSSDITVASADEKIAKVAEGKTRTIVPVAMGTTTLTVSVKGKEVGTIKVTVKKNAEEVKIDAPETVAAGEAFTVTLPRKGVDTDERALACDSKDVTIEDANGYGTKYTVTAAKAGKITLKACAFQSATYTDAIVTAEKEIVVGSKPVSIAQTSETTAVVTCVGDASALTSATAYTLLTDGVTKINVPVKSVVAKDNTATVTFFTALTKGVTYYVVVADQTLELKAATLEDKDAAEIIISTKTAVKGEDTTLEYKVVDANGIEIKNFSNIITFTVEPTSDAYIVGNKLNIWTAVDKTVKVTAKSDIWYTDADGKYVSKTITGTADVTSVAKADYVFAGLDWTVVPSATVVNFAASDYKQNTTVPFGEAYKIVAQINNTLEGKKQTPVAVTAGNGYGFESTNTQALIVDAAGNILPVKADTMTQVIVKGTTDATKSFVQVINVTVGPARKIASVEVALDKNVVNTTDKAVLTVKKVDNYGVKTTVTPSAVTVVKKSDDTATVTISSPLTTASQIQCDKKAVVVVEVKYTEGSFEYKEQKQITFDTKGVADVNGYVVTALTSDNKTEIDTKIDNAASWSQVADIKLQSMSGAYVVNNNVTWYKYNAYVFDGTNATTQAITKNAIAVQVLLNGTDVTAKVINGSNKFQPFDTTAHKKAAAGNYNILVYKFEGTNADAKSLIASTTFTVKDTQPALTVSLVDNTKNDKTAFEVKYNGEKVDGFNMVPRSIAGADYQVIDKITYTVSDFVIEVAGPWVIAK